MNGVVLARTAGGYRVHPDAGELPATLRGKLKSQAFARVGPGDVGVLEGSTISEIRPRRSVLARRAAQGSSGAGPRRAQPVAANVDQVIVVTSARDPEPSPRMIDRFLIIAEANGLPAAVVLNKIELDRAVEETLARRFKTAGYQLLGTSVKADEGLPALRDLLRGRHSVFTGASGAGKSSLLNALEPGLKLRVGVISEKWRTGKHTTTAAELVPVAGVGYVVDTPGLREIGAWGIDPNELGACFPEFRPYLDQCRFDNCRHLAEPGCAVRGAPAGAAAPALPPSHERIYAEGIQPSSSRRRRRRRRASRSLACERRRRRRAVAARCAGRTQYRARHAAGSAKRSPARRALRGGGGAALRVAPTRRPDARSGARAVCARAGLHAAERSPANAVRCVRR